MKLLALGSSFSGKLKRGLVFFFFVWEVVGRQSSSVLSELFDMAGALVELFECVCCLGSGRFCCSVRK